MSIESYKDLDPQETREWVDSLEAVIEREGPERAHFILEKLYDNAHRTGAELLYSATTAYINTRLCRYIARPEVSENRLSLLRNGNKACTADAPTSNSKMLAAPPQASLLG